MDRAEVKEVWLYFATVSLLRGSHRFIAKANADCLTDRYVAKFTDKPREEDESA